MSGQEVEPLTDEALMDLVSSGARIPWKRVSTPTLERLGLYAFRHDSALLRKVRRETMKRDRTP